MQKLVAVAVAGALSTAGCAPALIGRQTSVGQVKGRWENVVALPPGTPVRVFTPAGRHEGAFIAADAVELQVRTRNGVVLLPSALVLRVDRLETLPTRSRGHRAIVSAAIGTAATVAATVLGIALFCKAMSGRACWVPPSPRAVAGTAAAYGALGALSEEGRPLTIYVRP